MANADDGPGGDRGNDVFGGDNKEGDGVEDDEVDGDGVLCEDTETNGPEV